MWHEVLQPKLDAAQYVNDPEARRLALVVSEEVENARSTERSTEAPITNLLSQQLFPSADKPWHEYALDLDLLRRVSERLNMSLPVVARSIQHKFRPPNWQSFFWMAAWLDEISAERNKARMLGVILETQARMATATKNQVTQQAKAAADARHSRPGGSRDKQAAIKAAWASGIYGDRDLCATEEYEALGFGAWGTARRALRNTPDPDPWPGKKSSKGTDRA